jgi:hypothetical protein
MMAWNPAIPATNADLLSAPVRDNFGALDTALMAALATLANGAVLTKAAGPVITGVPSVATGAVLASAGVTTAPTWSVSPALTDLKLGGGAIGTSGVGVLALGPATTPTTSPVDTVQLYTVDVTAEAGSRALQIRDERGGTCEIGSSSGGFRQFMTSGAGTGTFTVTPTLAIIGTNANIAVNLIQNSTTRINFDTGGYVLLNIVALGLRAVGVGATDSGGAGYRMLRCTN